MAALTIIRGLPGSGKTTLAKKMKKVANAVIIEPDALLTDAYGGYHYTQDLFREAVKMAVGMVRDAAKLERNVIYADVLPTRRDVERVCTAFRLGVPCCRPVRIAVFWLPCTVAEAMARNVHRVREEDIRRMADTWEAWPTEEIVKTDIREL